MEKKFKKIMVLAKRVYVQSLIANDCTDDMLRNKMLQNNLAQCKSLEKALTEYLASERLYNAIFGGKENENEEDNTDSNK